MGRHARRGAEAQERHHSAGASAHRAGERRGSGAAPAVPSEGLAWGAVQTYKPSQQPDQPIQAGDWHRWLGTVNSEQRTPS